MPKQAQRLLLTTATLMFGGCLDASVHEPDDGLVALGRQATSPA